MRKFVTVVLLCTVACHKGGGTATPTPVLQPPAPVIVSADDLIAAMHDRYAGQWYRNMTFVQKSTTLRADGSPAQVDTWYEAAIVPGRLRIDFGDPARGDGVLYRDDSAYSVQGGRISDRRAGRNPLLVLGFDVYGQPVSKTLDELRAEHINVAVLHTDSLYGRKMYVVGAGPADTTSNQFWVDAANLLFVRLIQTNPERHVTRDIRFEKYVQHDGGWIAEDVRIFAGGRLFFREEYSNVRVNVPLDEDLFLPEKWSTASHWYKP